MTPLREDKVLRAITNDGAFRVITVTTTDTVRGAVAAQKASGETVGHFCDLITGTILVRETMAPQSRVQGIVKGSGGRGSLVADSYPDGSTRGLVQLPPAASRSFSLGQGSLLQLMRSLNNGSIHQGVVDVPAAGGLTAALMVYMQESEQVISVIDVGASIAVGTGAVERAGGYIVQLLPEAPRGAHMVMTERLAAVPPLMSMLAEHTPRTLVDELLFGMPFTVLEESQVRHACHCSLEKVVSMLATLGKTDIAELVEAGEVIEIRCDYCMKDYEVAPENVRALLDES
jgi:molecular chaperone Hsp33